MPDTHSNDFWDARFDSDEYIYGTDPNGFLAEVLPKLPRGRVLSLGEGEGRNAVFLATQGFNVTAIDFSQAALKKTRALASQANVELETLHTDLATYRIKPQSWHVVVAIFCHLPSVLRRQVHRQIVKGLLPGGMLVLEAFTPAQLERQSGGPKSPDMLYRLTDLERDFHGLDLRIAHEILRPLHEGPHHQGEAAVVQLLAAKPLL